MARRNDGIEPYFDRVSGKVLTDENGNPRRPTEEEAWANFWEVIGPALVDVHRQGKLKIDGLDADGK